MDNRYFEVVCGRRLIQLDHLRGNIMMSTTEAILAQCTAIAVWRFLSVSTTCIMGSASLVFALRGELLRTCSSMTHAHFHGLAQAGWYLRSAGWSSPKYRETTDD